jgi:hypothetical protein
LGSVAVIMVKTFSNAQMQWSQLYGLGVMVFSVIGIIGTAMALYYFRLKYSQTSIQYA